jgi:hypothetical protein
LSYKKRLSDQGQKFLRLFSPSLNITELYFIFIYIIMPQIVGKDSKRHFTVVMGGKEHGLYVSSTPSSAAKKGSNKALHCEQK